MKERILIIFIAIAIGLVITTLIYFLYQQTKTIPQKAPGKTDLAAIGAPSPTISPGYLIISSPTNDSLTDKRLVTVKGSTHPEDTLIISSNQEDQVAKPTPDGKFTVSITIDAGANVIVVRSVAPDGSEHKDSRIVTYSTDQF